MQRCLKLCKSLGGPVVKVEEQHSILKYHPDQKEVIICNGLIYFREPHKLRCREFLEVIGKTQEERLLNLCAFVA